MYKADLEVTQQFDRDRFHIDASAGLSVAGYDHSRSATLFMPKLADIVLGYDDGFTGVGPTLDGSVRRQLGDSAFNCVADCRGTMLFGTHRDSLSISDNVPVLDLAATRLKLKTDTELYIAEFSMGLEWKREFARGRTFFASGLWESQFWGGSGVGIEGLGMTGMSFGMGISN